MENAVLGRLTSVRKVREEFLCGGIVPVGMVDDVILRSWQRSMERGIGMERGETRCTPRYDLMQRREINNVLMQRSQPVMENLYHEICGTSSMVLLADNQGVVLHSIGDPDFVDQADKVYLKPGGIWSEVVNGTNAIGTALEEQTAVQVSSSEHFIDKNRFISCSATPIFDPKGGILGVLDVSGDWRAHQKHTMALVRLSAQMIENQMFTAQFPDDIIICFHLRQEFIGTLYEGIVVFSPDGHFIGANRCALLQFGLDRTRTAGQTFSSIFGLSLAKLLEQSRYLPHPVLRLPLHSGVEVYGRVWSGTTVSPVTFLPVSSKGGAVVKNGLHSMDNKFSISALEHGDPTMQALISKALKVMGHDIPIMIEGESGTGKELLARGLHQASSRRNEAFVPINCASIPEGLFESELFGYQEGAFTGAKRKGNIGKIREADNGTLFLDEIGEMPLNLQARLLRVLQDRTVAPLGGSGSYQVNIAVICATNRRVRDAVASGKFREDLYYRLNGLLLTVPSLRDRQDQLELSHSILKSITKENRHIDISHEVLKIFQTHPWPGNIRQMHNLLKTAVALIGDRDEITMDDLPEDFLEQIQCYEESIISSVKLQNENPKQLLANMRDRVISETLAQNGGNMAETARKLGMSRNTLYRKLRGTMERQ